jgi:glutamate-ammonia-ligase adenylyltransferase
MNGLKRYGWRNEIDLRLRPEGGQGLLVRSHQGLRTYELERMEMWERFALGQARPVYGNPYSCALVQRVAYALPLTPENLQELVTMKRRIETERVQPQYLKRDVKLGYGGLSDIEWLVHLFEMRYPTTLEVGKHVTSADRIKRMAQAQLINAIERDQLIFARDHHLKVRNFLSLLGFVQDVLPENPDKLERVAGALGLKSGYEFQRQHASIIESVRAIYLEGLERLGV